MGESASVSRPENIGFEAYGVRVRVTAETSEILDRIRPLILPSAQACPPAEASESFGIRVENDGSYRFERGDSPVSRGIDLDFALVLMESQLRIYVGLNAPGKIFVHAGVVERNGQALVLPGLSLSGKTTLVAALVRAGATYYSDEFAVIDEAGLVHPFSKPLSIREHGAAAQTDHPVERFGGEAGETPVPIGALVFTEYRPGAEWDPTALSPGRAVLEMLANTLSARERSDEAFPIFKRAIDGAVLLKGERGEAESVAEQLLATVGDASLRNGRF